MVLDCPHDALNNSALVVRCNLKDLLEAMLRDLRNQAEELTSNLGIISKVLLDHAERLLEDTFNDARNQGSHLSSKLRDESTHQRENFSVARTGV